MSVLAFAISTKTINLHQVDKHIAVNWPPISSAQFLQGHLALGRRLPGRCQHHAPVRCAEGRRLGSALQTIMAVYGHKLQADFSQKRMLCTYKLGQKEICLLT
jgi:hypothetical protein